MAGLKFSPSCNCGCCLILRQEGSDLSRWDIRSGDWDPGAGFVVTDDDEALMVFASGFAITADQNANGIRITVSPEVAISTPVDFRCKVVVAYDDDDNYLFAEFTVEESPLITDPYTSTICRTIRLKQVSGGVESQLEDSVFECAIGYQNCFQVCYRTPTDGDDINFSARWFLGPLGPFGLTGHCEASDYDLSVDAHADGSGNNVGIGRGSLTDELKFYSYSVDYQESDSHPLCYECAVQEICYSCCERGTIPEEMEVELEAVGDDDCLGLACQQFWNTFLFTRRSITCDWGYTFEFSCGDNTFIIVMSLSIGPDPDFPDDQCLMQLFITVYNEDGTPRIYGFPPKADALSMQGVIGLRDKTTNCSSNQLLVPIWPDGYDDEGGICNWTYAIARVTPVPPPP
jgi:hypothetical protein